MCAHGRERLWAANAGAAGVMTAHGTVPLSAALLREPSSPAQHFLELCSWPERPFPWLTSVALL